jgi:hypothetical protein
MIHKTLHRKLKFEQLELHNRVLRKSSSSIIDTRRVTHLTICVRRDGKLIKVAVILGSPRPLYITFFNQKVKRVLATTYRPSLDVRRKLFDILLF